MNSFWPPPGLPGWPGLPKNVQIMPILRFWVNTAKRFEIRKKVIKPTPHNMGSVDQTNSCWSQPGLPGRPGLPRAVHIMPILRGFGEHCQTVRDTKKVIKQTPQYVITLSDNTILNPAKVARSAECSSSSPLPVSRQANHLGTDLQKLTALSWAAGPHVY